MYKLPEIFWRQVPKYVRNGSAYAYLGEDDTHFALSPVPITSVESAAGRTLNQVYSAHGKQKRQGESEQAHIFYNDENPDGKKKKFDLSFDL